MTEDSSTSVTPLTENEGAQALLKLMSSPDESSDSETHQTEEETEQDEAETPDQPEETSEDESPDEADQQPEEESEPDDEHEEEQETPKARKVSVKIDGKEELVDEEELRLGYMRGADYTRKRQAEAALEKQREADFQAVKAERQKYAQDITQIEAILKEVNGKEPDWATLQQGDLSVFAAEHAAWQIKKDQLAAVQALKADAEAKVQKDRVSEHNARVQKEAEKLPELIPAWKDQKVAQKELGEVVGFAKELGYTDADLANVADARVFVLLRKAMLFDKAQKAKPVIKAKIESVRTAAPGASTATVPRARREAEKAVARVAKTGSLEDGAEALLHLMRGK